MRLYPSRLAGACARSRLWRDEQGMALVLALVIVVVLTVVLTAVIFLTASSARDAKRTNAGQQAYAIAEAGLNNALAQLATHYPSYVTAGASSWVNGTSRSYANGTVSWTGTFDNTKNTWTLTGTGTVPNPTGGTAVVRTVTAKLPITVTPPKFNPFGLFVGDSDPSSCTTLSGGISINVPVYIASTGSCALTLGGSWNPYDAKIWEPPPYIPNVTVSVGGTLTLNGGTTIGTSTHNVKSIAYGSCSPSPCAAANGFNGPKGSFTQITPPSFSAQSIYTSQQWSSATCTTGSNPFDGNSVLDDSVGSFDFTSKSSFDCSFTDAQGSVHHLKWDSTTSTLTINDSWYIDGDFALQSNKGFKYTGSGTLYFTGTAQSLKGTICGPSSTYTAPAGCSEQWDPNQGQLLIVALNKNAVTSAFSLAGSAIFEADAWVIGKSHSDNAFQSTGSTWLGGSVFVNPGSASIQGNGLIHSYVQLPSGSPTQLRYAPLSPITSYKGG